MAQQSEHQPRHLLEEVRVLTEQMSQPSQSNVNAEVSCVFGRSQGRQGNPSSSINQNVSSASSTIVPRILNELQTRDDLVPPAGQISQDRKRNRRKTLHSCAI